MKTFLVLVAALTLALFTGCGDSHQHESGGGGHHHEAPHGGTLVEIGKHEYNLEFVLDPATGTLNAWVLDAHAEKFVRIAMDSFEVIAKVGDRTEKLVFKAVASNATGEKVGDTSQFTVQADWLKQSKSFEGMLKEIVIRGNPFTFLSFKFGK